MRKIIFYIFVLLFTFSIGVLVVSLVELDTDPIAPVEVVKPESTSSVEISTAKGLETAPTLIVAGQSVGRLFLGDSREKAIKLFGRIDTEYDYDFVTELNCSTLKELRFWEMHDKTSPFHVSHGNGAWVYLRDDKIFQIKIQSDKFATKDGVTVLSEPKKIKKLYPNSEAYVELNTQCNCTGGENLIYWIDKSSGIAFEFHYHQKKKRKYLAYIFVFEPNTEFLPDGCVYLETQGWEKLSPFTLTEPKSMQEDWEKNHSLRH